jgi:hypothetical protein
MLWNRPIGPKSKEAAILRQFMQEAIGSELRSQYELPLKFPRDLQRLVNEIDEQHKRLVSNFQQRTSQILAPQKRDHSRR